MFINYSLLRKKKKKVFYSFRSPTLQYIQNLVNNYAPTQSKEI